MEERIMRGLEEGKEMRGRRVRRMKKGSETVMKEGGKKEELKKRKK